MRGIKGVGSLFLVTTPRCANRPHAASSTPYCWNSCLSCLERRLGHLPLFMKPADTPASRRFWLTHMPQLVFNSPLWLMANSRPDPHL